MGVAIRIAEAFRRHGVRGIPYRKRVGRAVNDVGAFVIPVVLALVLGPAVAGAPEMSAGLALAAFANLLLLPFLLQKHDISMQSRFTFEFFHDALSSAERVGLKLASSEASYEPGEVLIEENFAASDVFFLMSGVAEYRHTGGLTQTVSSPDCLGEFPTALGPVSTYRVVARSKLRVLRVSAEFISNVAQENVNVRRMMEELFRRRVARIDDPVLTHNSSLFRGGALLMSSAAHAVAYLAVRQVLFPLLRVRIERPDGLRISDIPGNIIVICNHHTELDAALTGLAVSDSGLGQPRRGPFFIANERFWLSSRLLKAVSSLMRLLIVRSWELPGQQEGFQYFRAFFKPYREATVFVFPWARTPPGVVNAFGKAALPWIVESLDCTIVPVCALGLDGAPVANLLRSIVKPVCWRIGLPVQARDLLKTYGTGKAAEEALARQLVLLSGGKLRLVSERRQIGLRRSKRPA